MTRMVENSRIGVLSLGKIFGILYAFFGLVIGALMSLVFVFYGAMMGDTGGIWFCFSSWCHHYPSPVLHGIMASFPAYSWPFLII